MKCYLGRSPVRPACSLHQMNEIFFFFLQPVLYFLLERCFESSFPKWKCNFQMCTHLTRGIGWNIKSIFLHFKSSLHYNSFSLNSHKIAGASIYLTICVLLPISGMQTMEKFFFVKKIPPFISFSFSGFPLAFRKWYYDVEGILATMALYSESFGFSTCEIQYSIEFCI